jgi:hypothetical protein
MNIKQWHRAVAVTVSDALLKQFGVANGGLTEPVLPVGYQEHIAWITQTMVASEEEIKGPYVDTEEWPDGWRIQAEDLDEPIQQAIKEKGVYFKVYNVRVCPHLPKEDAKDHRLWVMS